MKRRPAFTLIELLVVVAIITALIAILLPSLGQAVSAAQGAVCMSNQRQVGLGWKAYIADHKGKLFDYTLQHHDRDLWTESLREYVADVGAIVVCPTTEDLPSNVLLGNAGIPGVRIGGATMTWVEGRTGYKAEEPFDRASYTYNGNLHPKSSYNTTEQRFQSISDIYQPASVPLIGDGDWRSAAAGATGSLKLFPTNLQMPVSSMPAGADAVWRFATNRHGFRSNIAFIDGHTAPIELPDLWQLKWHKTYDTTTPVSGAP